MICESCGRRPAELIVAFSDTAFEVCDGCGIEETERRVVQTENLGAFIGRLRRMAHDDRFSTAFIGSIVRARYR